MTDRLGGTATTPTAPRAPSEPAIDTPDQARVGHGHSPPGGKRHQARIVALQILFEIDVTDHRVDEVMERTREIEDLPTDIDRHARRLVQGVLAARDTIDPLLAKAAPAFPIAQIPAVDRNVLRLAIHELLNEPTVPIKSAINEAVELAKRFGGDNSSRFVNGVLGTIAAGLPSERQNPPAKPAASRASRAPKGPRKR